jgi:hypothetical protein
MMSLPLYCVFSLFNTCLEFPNIFFRFPLKILKFRNNIAKIATEGHRMIDNKIVALFFMKFSLFNTNFSI